MKDSDIMENIMNPPEEELTIEELFKDYDREPFKSELVDFEPIGNEER